MIAQSFQSIPPERTEGEALKAFFSIARLIRDALDKLSEPNEAAIHAARIIVGGTLYASPRAARDLCAAILKAQLEGGLR